jgi:hypothetical protein
LHAVFTPEKVLVLLKVLLPLKMLAPLKVLFPPMVWFEKMSTKLNAGSVLGRRDDRSEIYHPAGRIGVELDVHAEKGQSWTLYEVPAGLREGVVYYSASAGPAEPEDVAGIAPLELPLVRSLRVGEMRRVGDGDGHAVRVVRRVRNAGDVDQVAGSEAVS